MASEETKVLSIPPNLGVDIRFCRPHDTVAIRNLFRECLLDGADSPARFALKTRLKSYPSLLGCLLFFASSLCYFMSGRTSIVMLSCALLDIVFMGMFTYASIEVFVDAVSDTLRSDLEDPVAYYQMVPMEDGADASKYILSGVKALWVAELKTSANDTQIVGMIALDLVPNSSTKTGEIRRMFVSPLFRRVGVASSLMRVCESRAKAYGLSRIVLNTSEYQTGAMRLYEGAGYRIYNRRELRSRSGLGVVKMIDYCKNLGK